MQFMRNLDGSQDAGGVYPQFFVDPVKDEAASVQAGRPIFKNVEFVRIIMPSNQYLVPVHEVTDQHRERWARQYEAFKQGMEQPVDGTPLDEWPALDRAMIAELKGIKILTIEQMASLSDAACQKLMGGPQLRAKAKAYLDSAAEMALVDQLTAQNALFQSENAALKQQVKELGEATQRLHGEVMGMRNAPHPLAAMVPATFDPIEQARMQQAGLEQRSMPQSSLAAFADENKRRPGRPRKNVEEAAA